MRSPTSRPRISVTKDHSLADALQRGRRLLSSDAPEATLLRDLAIQGARLLAAEDARREHSLRDLADHDWLDERFESGALARGREPSAAGAVNDAGPFAGRPYVLDTSAWARTVRRAAGRMWSDAMLTGQLLITPVVKMELLYSTRDSIEFAELERRLDDMREAPLGRSVARIRRALRSARIGARLRESLDRPTRRGMSSSPPLLA